MFVFNFLKQHKTSIITGLVGGALTAMSTLVYLKETGCDDVNLKTRETEVNKPERLVQLEEVMKEETTE